ncbi:MAG: methyltransferase [Planctomycetota bacterium]
MSLTETLRFFRSYLNDPSVVGAVAPSSRYLAAALVRPFAHRRQGSRILEIGAGTGRITRCILGLLRPDDHFDICEINEGFADLLESRVLAKPQLQKTRRDGRIRLLRCPAESIRDPEGYDFIISGLPFTAFETTLVREILAAVRRNLRPGGVFSYFEYVGLRRLNGTLSVGRGRRRIRRVSALLDRHIDRHQFSRETVLLNFPPAHARHWRFEPSDHL